jgi:uncharacterized lipoprotein|tara:strand:+ start:28589 stop:29749 length:1161 start_codon:yes stop_codon:yes gene_type:complete
MQKYQSTFMRFRRHPSSLLVVSALLLLYGCSSTDELEPAEPDWNRTTQLEIPPDLTAPKDNANTEQFSAAARNASEAELGQYSQFQKFQQMADFQDFLKWRETHSADLDLSLAAFRKARDEAITQSLGEKGVLTLSTREGQTIVLMDDTLENCWQRLDTALTNIGVHVLARREDQGVFRVHYGTETPEDTGTWTDWIPWLSDPIIYQVALELTRNGPAVSIRDDEGQSVNTELANSFAERLGIQLLTFASDSAAVATPTVESSVTLQESASGYLTLVVSGAAGGVWNHLDRELQDMGFSIVNRDRTQLRFVVRYDDPSKLADKTWFQSLAFWKKDASAPAEDLSVVLTPAGAETHVNVLDAADQQTELGDQVVELLAASLKAKEEN